MPTHDVEPDAPIDLEALRARIIADAPPPAADPADFQLIADEARRAMERGDVVSRGTQLRVRLTGDGVRGNDIPVHSAARLLDALQGAITAVGSSVQKSKHLKTPKDPQTGKRSGIKKATEMHLSPTIGSGSVVFFLEGEAEQLTGDELLPVGTDGLLDTAVAEFFDVIKAAQSDDAGSIGLLTDILRKHGAMVASKLNSLAEETVNRDLELDMGHRAPSGGRNAATLQRRGSQAIKDAVDRNRDRTEEVTLTGVLHTVSDGADMLRMTLDDGVSQVRLRVEPGVGVGLGHLLGKRIVAEVTETVKWKLASGREKRSYVLISASPSDAAQEVSDPLLPGS